MGVSFHKCVRNEHVNMSCPTQLWGADEGRTPNVSQAHFLKRLGKTVIQ
jgi:hypothetical protein